MASSLATVKKSILAALERRRWTERDLSRASKVNATTINNFLKSPEKDIQLTTLEALANGLGVSVTDLITEPDASSSQKDLAAAVLKLDPEIAKLLSDIVLKILALQRPKV